MRRIRLLHVAPFAVLCLTIFPPESRGEKPLLTLDEFFNSVEIRAVKISPDGHAVIIETMRAEWEENRFRSDLWLYREEGSGSSTLVQLTQSGHDRSPEWSPDGRWIAFLSDRKLLRSEGKSPASEGTDEKKARPVAQLYLIATNGGEAFPLTQGGEEVHAFAWSADSRALYFATRTPWTKPQQESYEKEWNDAIQFRESERGDAISRVEIAAVPAHGAHGTQEPDVGSETRAVATTPLRVQQMAASPDGRWLAFATDSPSKRMESLDPYGTYLVDLPGGLVHLASHTQAIYEDLLWAPDSRHIFFLVNTGSAEGQYQDVQPRVYWVDVARGSIDRWGARFPGGIIGYTATASSALLGAGRIGTEVQVYFQQRPDVEFVKQPGWPGTYERLSTATHSPRVAFVFSSLQQPPEVYLAQNAESLPQARAITAFNQLFNERALPEGKPYRWTADDGTAIEGMLIYPPGKLGARHLRTLTLIHGGPLDADGNHFEADWYQWATLAATHNWLVFEPNYRGSIGYGDEFALQTVPQLLSRPGKDILEGIDALVKDGIADPEHLTIGGYSEGGYLTNWLITQTSRFQAAVTGAGAIEHAADWGNDDMPFDDAYSLGGAPWEAKKNYNDEAALWQINKVRTPTHIVVGAEDIRVFVGEAYLLERALHTLGIPTRLLVFPGEGHELNKNPWHGKIKVREELKWLERYGGR